MEENQVKRAVRVYACGGCGVNIGALLEPLRNSKDPCFADIETAYIDTSKSNTKHHDINDDEIYLIDNVDGSGKIRKENHREIAARAKDMVQRFPAGDLNIVIHSAAGGSGSVIGPSIASELLDKKLPTIIMMVGSADTVIDVNNTLKTMKSYDGVVDVRGVPVVMIYEQNSRANKRETVDAKLKAAIISLAVLWSGNNLEMDSKDLYNFLNFQEPTSFRPQLAHLSLIGPGEQINFGQGANIISIATLANKGQDITIDTDGRIPEVQYVGYLREDANERLISSAPTHFIVTDAVFEEVNGLLSATLKQVQSQQQARVQKERVITDDDQPTASGLVL